MIRSLVLGVGMVLPLAAVAASLGGQHTEPANAGETEQVVCERALDTLQESLRKRLQDEVAATAGFEQLYQVATKRRLARDALEAALSAELQAQLLFTETERYWSGKRCFVQGLADVDAQRLLAALHADLPPQPAPEPESEQDDGWTIGVPGFFTDASAFNTALVELGFLKTVVAEHYLLNGSWPRTLAEAQLSAHDMATFEAVDVVAFGPEGEVVATLAGELQGEEIRLIPRVTGHMIRWRCATTLDSWAARACR